MKKQTDKKWLEKVLQERELKSELFWADNDNEYGEFLDIFGEGRLDIDTTNFLLFLIYKKLNK